MRNFKRVQQGFTLIELMIVIAIIAILVAIAVPAYQDYTIRTKVSECINNAAPVKLAVSETYQSQGFMPGDLSQAGVNAQSGDTQYCDATTYTGSGDTGTITVNVAWSDIGGAAAMGSGAPTLTGTGDTDTGDVDWVCNNGGANTRWLPATCRDSSAP